ncbi:PH domain-containing protein [Streptomyces sp. NPDC050388]|uniref:PH domain-containing protein n=1 Tax=Streptomyces sp. NPDC050388 TaxID=3155781 RepID=UPI00344632FE
MSDPREVTCRPQWTGFRWTLVGLGAIGTAAAVLMWALAGPAVWAGIALLPALATVTALHKVTVWVRADAHGVHSRSLVHRRSVRWSDITDLRVRLKYADTPRAQDVRRLIVVPRVGRKWALSLPMSYTTPDPEFDETLETFRELHRQYGTPESSHLVVISSRTAGRGFAGSLLAGVLLLAAAGLVASFVPGAEENRQAWSSAVPCTADTPAAERGEACLTTLPAVIEHTEVQRPKKASWLYFTDARPLERLQVSREAAQAFRAGDDVELTFWHGRVMEVAGERHVWHEHIPTAGSVTVAAAVVALIAGYPAARVLLTLRSRRRPDGEVLPEVLPFVVVLVGTALWLIPLCYLHPTTLFTSPLTTVWPVAGTAASLALFAWAWRATRVRVPEEGTEPVGPDGDEEVFLPARFLEATDYNPHRFGTHIALGGGPPAVVPHPDRFAAKPIPAERLTLKKVRPAQGSDGELVPRTWHVAELDDAGTPVRLTASPEDLPRILRHLTPGRPSPGAPPQVLGQS